MRFLKLMAIAGVLFAAGSASAEDWPTYRHDLKRSNCTDQALRPPLRLAWRYVAAQPPSPAWHDPFRFFNRSDFDHAFAPVVADGRVVIASSSDDTVRALDLDTGRELWRFAARGPVRCAPQLEGGRAYFGSDDGYVYCLDAASGKQVWSFRAAPTDEWLSGNGRMISRWPVRSGVLVADGVAYCVAGMWPTEGVFAYALDARDGKPRWRNDTLGTFGSIGFVDGDGGHQGEFGPHYISPQGSLLLHGDMLLIPRGYAAPVLIDRRDGKFWAGTVGGKKGVSGPVRGGGTFVTIDEGRYYVKTLDRSGTLVINGYPLDPQLSATRTEQAPQMSIEPIRNPNSKVSHERGAASLVVRKGKLIARKADGLALAGEHQLIWGTDGLVRLVDSDTEREFWRANVLGEAREFAIASGRLIVSTDRGEVSCFAAGTGPDAAPPEAAREDMTPPSPAHAAVVESLRTAGMDRGFALVVGDEAGDLCVALARQTQLHVECAMPDETRAAALRERLLATTAFHGSRIHVTTPDRTGRFPFAQYFANAVIVAGEPGPVAPAELYRMLRPVGGVALFPGLAPQRAMSVAQAMQAPGEKPVIQNADGVVRLERGRLPGATDWDNEWDSDKTIKWPLRPLWFGGPTTEQTQGLSAGSGNGIGGGRYFVRGEDSITAVDAYNGTVLWTRPIPRRSLRFMLIDGVIFPVNTGLSFDRADQAFDIYFNGDWLMLGFGSAGFNGREAAVIQVDPRNGQQKSLAAPYARPPMFSLTRPQSWSIEFERQFSAPPSGSPLEVGIEEDGARLESPARKPGKNKAGSRPPPAAETGKPAQVVLHEGEVTLENTDEALLVRLTTKDPVVTRWDVWDLHFDFRPIEYRFGLLDRGAFQVRVTPALDDKTPARWEAVAPPGCQLPFPAAKIQGRRIPGGTEATLTIPWSEIAGVLGGGRGDARPTSFGFAAGLVSADSPDPVELVQRYALGDAMAGGVNNGWPNVFLGEAPAAVPSPKNLQRSLPRAAPRRGAESGIDAGLLDMPRLHPLTGEPGPRVYRSGNWGCGGPTFSADVVFRRSGGGLGMYDFLDDSGLRWFGGVKAGCTTPRIIGMGVMILSEEAGHCNCPFYRTAVAFAHAERRLHEDWALFYDRGVDTLVRTAAINLGAPGDRRDEAGTLWLGFPRPGDAGRGFPLAPGTTRLLAAPGEWIRHESAALQVPLEVHAFPELGEYNPADNLTRDGVHQIFNPYRTRSPVGPYRVNADVVPIAGTDRPWIYASGFRGLRTATLRVSALPMLRSRPAPKPWALDGKIDEPALHAPPQAVLPNTKTELFLAHDDDNLYIAARRPHIADRLGKYTSWTSATQGEDAPIWNDDSFEVFLSDAQGKAVVHLGLSSSGARFDALARGDASEDAKWNGGWRGVARAVTPPEAPVRGGSVDDMNRRAASNTLEGGDDRGPANELSKKERRQAPAATPPTEPALLFELAIPWATLAEAGIQREQLAVNLMMNQIDLTAEADKNPGGEGHNWTLPGWRKPGADGLIGLGARGRERCAHFAPLGLGRDPAPPEREFTVRLHFAELDGVAPGTRVFDVRLQGQTVAPSLDIAREAGPNKALVREFPHVRAGAAIELELAPRVPKLTAETAPILSAIEVVDESFRAPTPPAPGH